MRLAYEEGSCHLQVHWKSDLVKCRFKRAEHNRDTAWRGVNRVMERQHEYLGMPDNQVGRHGFDDQLGFFLLQPTIQVLVLPPIAVDVPDESVHRRKQPAERILDVGRVWTELPPGNRRFDGDGPGLKLGVGAGPRLQWGETFLIRIDLAWSPDADPIGVYFDVSHVF